MTNPLKTWRGERTQDQAAELVGVSAMTWSRWERGIHLPRKHQWPVIEKETGVTPERLFKFVADEVRQ